MSEIKFPKSELININELVINEKNVKEHHKEQIHDIAELMKIVGFKDPIVIDINKKIWAGHGRLEAARYLDIKKVPCIYLNDISEDQKKVFMLMDNKVNESDWHKENITKFFDEINPIEFQSFEMKFPESIKVEFTPKEVTTIDEELVTKVECPKCGYKW